MSKYGRSRKEQNMDRKDKHKDMTENVDMKALERFKAKAYPHTDVIGYLKMKGHDVKGEMSVGRCEKTE